MERTGLTPPGAVVAPDLADVLRSPGPFATVYLTTESHIENAAYHSEQHWKVLRAELADAGMPEAVLADIDTLVPDAHLAGQCLAVVAVAGGVLHVEHGPEPPPRDRARWAPLPSLVPILQWRQSLPTYLTVLADRAGADLCVYRHERPDVHREAGGGTDPLHRAAAGGWSQLRYQHRAENTWEHNADDVAGEIVSLADRFDPRLVLVAGDVRAVQLIGDALPGQVADRVEVVQGSRTEDGSDDEFAEAVRGHLAGAVATDTVHLLEKFTEELGQEDRAADGASATLAALARAQVEVLLVHEAPDDERRALFGPEPTQVGLRADELALGVDEAQEGALVDVAVRAALGTGAGVRVVPGGDLPTDGLGAILRWS
ncbi:MAG TPA: Vms1/Ankzf1 family peptidyl-tRNA hydrolase [Acidimicrobiales bacterium]|nr:Vms1/Ankzf1 family peptidyl-tRNA hydrolase [Acidimicrobiales bacterium]